MKAIKVIGCGAAAIQEVPVPRLRDNYVLCKVNRFTLNSTDWYVVFSNSTNNRADGSIIVGSTWISLLRLMLPQAATLPGWLKRSDQPFARIGKEDIGLRLLS